MKKRVFAAVAAGVVTVGTVVTGMVPAATADSPRSEVRSGYLGQCLDADLDTAGANGTKVQLWNCNGQRQQQWYTDGFTIRNALTNSCLDADLNTIGANGTKVQLWNCNGQSQQQWFAGRGAVYSLHNGHCLDADANTGGANGTKVQLWNCNGQQQQQWAGLVSNGLIDLPPTLVPGTGGQLVPGRPGEGGALVPDVPEEGGILGPGTGDTLVPGGAMAPPTDCRSTTCRIG